MLLFSVCLLHFPSAAEDEEDTIAAQEKVEGNVNHAEELDDLAKEGKCLFFPLFFSYFFSFTFLFIFQAI